MREKHEVLVDLKKCVGCGECARDCPNACLAVRDGKAVFGGRGCIMCGHCAAVCPAGAVSLSGFDASEYRPVSAVRQDPASLLAAMRSRRSVRRFKAEAVSRSDLEMIIEAGRASATARNRQRLSYVVLVSRLREVEDEAVRFFRDPVVARDIFYGSLSPESVGDDFFFRGGPAVILVNAPDSVDAALAASKMEEMALSLGLGVFYCGFFVFAANKDEALREKLGMSERDKAAMALVLGHPDVAYARTAPKEPAHVAWM